MKNRLPDGRRGIIFFISLYKRFVSPFFRASCRFYPTCSEYCGEAVEKYGAVKGLALGIKRVLKCHQFNKGGFDPVN